MTAPIEIIPFEDRHAAAFRDINFAWIKAHFYVEPKDHEYLDHPRRNILDGGGAILIAEDANEVVGTSGLLSHGRGEYELVKMAVVPSHQGRGIGRQLLEATINCAQGLGGQRLWLTTSSRLQTAIQLYERMGFRSIPLPPEPDYVQVDLAYERRLDR